jgi:hypothetical protein
MKTIQLKVRLPDEEADAFAGTYLNEDAYDVLVDDEDCTVLKPDGSPLVIYRAGVLPGRVCKQAWESLRAAATPTDNRGMAAGKLDAYEAAKDQDALSETTTAARGQLRRKPAAKTTDTRFFPVKADGTVSKTSYAKTVKSGIVGYFDRYPRIPYCRTTAYNLAEPDKFLDALPFVRAVARVFQEEAPERFSNQNAMIRRTHPDFYIHGTPFTTITVNKNWQTAVHKDAGDYPDGFGVMAVLQAGKYEGANLVFPQYRVAVNMRTRGVCLADVHEWHGNTPIRGVPGLFERISCVFYFRENMWKCGSAAQELERAKNKKPGDPLYDDDEDVLAQANN